MESKAIKRKATLEYIDYFRAIAILLIVAAHTLVWGDSTMRETNIYLFTGGTFLFVFISGFLFQYLIYKFEYLNYLNKKFINVIMPFIVIMLPIAIAYTFTKFDINGAYSNAPRIFRFFICFFAGQTVNQSMWYIGMIVIFFLLAPVFKYLQKFKMIWYSIFLCSIIYTLQSNRIPVPFPNWETGIMNIMITNIYFYLRQFVYFASAYMIGIELCKNIEKYPKFIQKHQKNILILLLICFVFDFICHLYITKLDAGLQSLQKIIECAFFIFLFITFENKIKNNFIIHKCLKFIANYSFGIFFIHSLVINIVWCHCIYMTPQFSPPAYVYENTINGFIYSIKLYLLVLFTSIAILWILKNLLQLLKIKNTRMFIGV